MQSQEISLCEHFIEIVEELDLKRPRARGREIGIVSNRAHTESDCPAGDLAADSSHAEDAQGFATQLNTFKALSIPTAGLHAGIGLRDASGNRYQQRESVFSGRYRVACGCVHHDDPAPGSGFDIHIINPDTGPADGF